MIKALKAIMCIYEFKNVYHKSRTNENLASYKKRMNLYVNLLQKTKKAYFQRLNVKYLSDNKKIWKAIHLSRIYLPLPHVT